MFRSTRAAACQALWPVASSPALSCSSLSEILDRVVRERFVEVDAGVIDQHVNHLEARYGRLHDLGGSCRLADVAVNPSDLVESLHLRGLGHLPRTRDNVEPSCDERLHDPRADPLRRSGHDGCLRWVAHICLPRKRLVTEGAGSVSLDFDCSGVGYT